MELARDMNEEARLAARFYLRFYHFHHVGVDSSITDMIGSVIYANLGGDERAERAAERLRTALDERQIPVKGFAWDDEAAPRSFAFLVEERDEELLWNLVTKAAYGDIRPKINKETE